MKANVAVNVPEVSDDVKVACMKYARAVGLAERKVNSASWMRAAAALPIKIECEKCNADYLKVAVAECDVSSSLVSMDVHAEELRLKLKYEVKKLPANSLSAFYELYRGHEAALFIADLIPAATKAAEQKLREIGKKIAGGEFSSRDVRDAYEVERIRAKDLRHSKHGTGKRRKITAVPATTLNPLGIEGLKEMVEREAASAEDVRVVTIKPATATARGVKEYFSNRKNVAQLTAALPQSGSLWIFIDLKPAETATPKADDAAASA